MGHAWESIQSHLSPMCHDIAVHSWMWSPGWRTRGDLLGAALKEVVQTATFQFTRQWVYIYWRLVRWATRRTALPAE